MNGKFPSSQSNIYSVTLLTAITFLTILSINQPVFSQPKEITLEDIFLNGKFRGEFLTGTTWIPGDEAYSFLKRRQGSDRSDLWRTDLVTGKEELLLSADSLKQNATDEPFSIDHYEWTSDGRYLLFTGRLVARALKTGGEIYIYDRQMKRFFKASADSGDHQIAQLSPDGKKLGFVRDNNLFVTDLETKKTRQLTFDGTDQILNGHFDWVYEEEFSIINGWEWSPDSRQIAFWRLDQTDVPRFKISLYSEKYLEFNDYKYPKAGDPNSKVSLGVVSVDDGSVKWIDLGEDTDIYIPRMSWIPGSGDLAYQRLNRLQSKNELFRYSPATNAVSPILTETSTTWVEVHDNLKFLKNGKELIWSSERDGFNHLYLMTDGGKVIRQLTKGQWDVDQVLRVDEKSGFVYFLAAKESPMTRDLYRVALKDGKLTRLTIGTGTHRISLHPDQPWFIDYFSNVSTPTKTILCNLDGKQVQTIIENPMTSRDDYQLPKVEFITIPAADGTPLNAWIMKPVNFDDTKPHPVLQFVYGGPGSQTVLDAWGRDYFWYSLLSQKGYIIVSADNRGTGNRGQKFKTVTYKRLGEIETDDQIAVAKWLGSQPWVDKARIGIWGWSYGGYMSSYSLFKGNDVFKAAIAVAPVTDWRFYDTIYTERFMQTPQLNPEGYKQSAPINIANQLKGNFLLIHGTADDNVHFQNAVELADKLISEGIQFDTMFYPDKYHGISGGKSRYHLYTYMTNWLLRNL